MDEMTQHNAALVEETNAAIEQTEAQARELDRVVDIFTIDAVPGPQSDGQPALRELQQKVASAARSYLTQGNAALDPDWQQF
jgi:methyl-accepting chemotaxis protein